MENIILYTRRNRLLLLRRRRDEDVVEVDDDENEPKDAGFTKLTTTGDKKDPNKIQPKDTIPRIYACATM